MAKHITRKGTAQGRTVTLERAAARRAKTANVDWKRLGRDLGAEVIL